MRIILVSNLPYPDPEAGGIQSIIEELAKQFQSSGNSVAILSEPHSRGTIPQASPVACAYLPIPTDKRERSSFRRMRELIRRPLRIRSLASFLRRWRPDVVNTHRVPDPSLRILVDVCRSLAIPLVQTLNAPAVSRVDEKLGGDLRRFSGLEHVSAITTLSEAVKTSYKNVLPEVSHATVIVGGVDYDAARTTSPLERDRPYIFFAGRLVLKHKAIDSLISAFAMIAPEYPELDLLLAGDGSDRAEIEKQITTAQLGGRVQMLGARPRAELLKYYKGATFFACPSRWIEGLGLVFLEAIACGTPVIATARGGTSEIVLDGKTGILISGILPEDVASAMRRLLGDSKLRSVMSQNCKALAAQYDWPQVASKFMAVYESVLPLKASAQATNRVDTRVRAPTSSSMPKP